MPDNKVIYLKDALANKTPAEILDMMPFMVCIEEYFPKCVREHNGLEYQEHTKRTSFDVIGVTKDSILLGTIVYSDNDDDFGWSPYIAHNSYLELKLNKLDNVKNDLSNNQSKYEGLYEKRYIFCHECTQKQKEFLVKYCDYDKDDVISGYEAFYEIQKTTQEWEKKKNRKSKTSSDRYVDYVQGRLETMDMEDFMESPLYFDEPH